MSLKLMTMIRPKNSNLEAITKVRVKVKRLITITKVLLKREDKKVKDG